MKQWLRFSCFYREHCTLPFEMWQAIVSRIFENLRIRQYIVNTRIIIRYDLRSMTELSLHYDCQTSATIFLSWENAENRIHVALSPITPTQPSKPFYGTHGDLLQNCPHHPFSPENQLNDVPQWRESFRITFDKMSFPFLAQRERNHSMHLWCRSKSSEYTVQIPSQHFVTRRLAYPQGYVTRRRKNVTLKQTHTVRNEQIVTDVYNRAYNARCGTLTSELWMRVALSLSPLWLRSRDWECGEREAPSDFRGIHCHPYRRGSRMPLPATRVLCFPCRADPTTSIGAARYPRSPRVHLSSYPLSLLHPLSSHSFLNPSWRGGRHPGRSYVACTYISSLSNRETAWITYLRNAYVILLLKYLMQSEITILKKIN